jgi:hypothetical protein
MYSPAFSVQFHARLLRHILLGILTRKTPQNFVRPTSPLSILPSMATILTYCELCGANLTHHLKLQTLFDLRSSNLLRPFTMTMIFMPKIMAVF